MNEQISQYLNKYITNPDPQYAVILKGKWGCGKTFFISNWIKEYKKGFQKGKNTLDPIYVSLYGLNKTSQITRAIDCALHPYLYSKGAEFTKKLFKVAGKLAFKTSLDWNNDGKDDISLDATLDSFSLLTSDLKQTIETKLIVFDDLERCLIDMKLLLGYINNFVEHGSCHVILVGDETHACDETKQILVEFKEKTIGREFELEPDIDTTITHFLTNDIPLSEWLQNQKELITDIFNATNCNNLRILRQCLYDFNTLFLEVEKDLTEMNITLMPSILATYIATYCEYRGEYHDLFTKWNRSYTAAVAGDKETQDRLSNLQNKYREVVEKYNFEILNHNHINNIVYEIETGNSLQTYVKNLLEQIQHVTTPQNKLSDFINMSSETFEAECSALIDDIENNKIPNMYMWGQSVSLLSFFDEEGLYCFKSETISLAKNYIKEIYSNQTNKEELYELRNSFYQGIHYINNFKKSKIENDFLDFTKEIFETYEKNIKDKFENALLNLTDENIESLVGLSQEATSDHQCSYDMISAFKNINVDCLYNNIRQLSNKSLAILGRFFSKHYTFYAQLGQGCNNYSDDLPVLSELKRKLEKESQRRKPLDKYCLCRLMKYLDGAIRRAKGENGVIEIS